MIHFVELILNIFVNTFHFKSNLFFFKIVYQFEELETKITLNGLKYFVLLSHSEVGETIFSQRHKMQFFFFNNF